MQDPPASIFVHPRKIIWADSDPARIAYTGRFPNFALEAIEAWCAERLGLDWFGMHRTLGGGTPFVHMSMDFRSSLRPGDDLFSTVALRRAGRSSLEFSVTGRLADGTVSFEGTFVCAFVDDTTHKSRPIPEQFRAAIADELALAEQKQGWGAAPNPAGAVRPQTP
jgi:acyl-CoA thioesterase FadM